MNHVTAPAVPAGAPGPPALAVYGSCVARDTVEHLPPGSVRLVRYVARQSLISAMSPPLSEDPAYLDALPSAFQRRVLGEDARSALLRTLARDADLDAVLWDLTDERLGVYLFDDGGVVTRTTELVASGAEEALAPRARLLGFGSDEHLERWTEALGRFLRDLPRRCPGARLAVLPLPWAERTAPGAPTRPSFGVGAAEANATYRPYYAALEAAGVELLDLGGLVPLSSPSHRWGDAPFHYDDDTYRVAADAVLRFLSGVTTPTGRPAAGGVS